MTKLREELARELEINSLLLRVLKNIANAQSKNFIDDTDFRDWAQSKARQAIAKAEGRP
jgi:hypothetical protein